MAGRAQMLIALLLNLVLDVMFVLGWAAIHRIGQDWLAKVGEVTGLDAFSLLVVTGFFTGSTLVAVSVFVIRDLINTVLRIWNWNE